VTLIWLLALAGLWAACYLAARNIAARRGGNWPFAAEGVAAAGLLALAVVGFFWQIIFTPNTWMPAGGGDLAPFLYPNYRFAAEQLRQGNLPLWNPYLYSGAPFAADIQSGLFYPVNLLLFLLVPNFGYGWLEALAMFHFWLAGVTMYILLRCQSGVRSQESGIGNQEVEDERVVGALREAPLPGATPALQPHERASASVRHSPFAIRNFHRSQGQLANDSLHPLAAFAGALAFAFSDLFIVHFGNLNLIAVAAWLPLVFLLFQRSLARRSRGLAAAAGVILAIATLAGHIQITLFILLTLGLYAIYDFGFTIYESLPRSIGHFGFWTNPLSNSPNPPNSVNSKLILHPSSPAPSKGVILHPFIALFITLLVTVALSALLLLPAFEMSRYTPRAELPYEEAARYSLHPVQLAGLLVPNYFGRDPALHWGPWERVETGYIGVATLLLAVFGALAVPGRRKGFFVALALVSLLLALGGYSLLHGWLYALTPGFNQLRAPARFILLLDFALAALAALGINQLLRSRLDDSPARLLGQTVRVATWGIGGLLAVALPLSYYAMLVTQDRNPAIFNRATAAASGVATFALFAIAALTVLGLINSRRLRQTGAGLALIAVIGLDLFTLGANVDVGHTDPTAGFNHPEAIAFLQNDPNLFRVEVTTDVWHAWQPNTALVHRLFDAWGLYNPLTLADTTLYWSGAPPRSTGRYNLLGIKYIIASKAGAPADGDIVPIFDTDPQVNIYLNQSALARVLFVGNSTVVANHDAAWEAIRADDFDPATGVILEGGQALAGRLDSELAILAYQPERVSVGVTTDAAGYLVLADAYYPGWQATVDGAPAAIERANYAFRAVLVPPGEHTVEFVFAPAIWRLGLAISGAALLALLGWAGWSLRR